jgi:5-methylcytosine-specific restriction enzyme subunit McrC
MRVAEFLRDHLRDNRRYLAGLHVGERTTQEQGPETRLQLTDTIMTARKSTDFLRRVEVRVDRALQEGDDLIVRFGEEFELARDQTFIHLDQGSLDEALAITTGNIIGHIRGRDRSVQVTSRFGRLFLLHMIASIEGFLELDELGGVSFGGENEWLLVYLWKTRLRRAFATGVPKMYQGRKEQAPRVRGRLDINAWLRVPADTGRYPCLYREHAFDNPITRLVHTTFEALTRRGGFDAMMLDAHLMRNVFAEACGGRRAGLAEKIRRVSNPYFAAYDEVAELSRKILNEETADPGLDEEEFSGFLFDVSMLFEHYIRKVLEKGGLEVAPKTTYADAVFYPRGRRPLTRALLPDMLLRGSRGTLVLDAKYKHFDEAYGVSRDDAFQVMTYAAAYRRRYENSKPIIGYGFVFPSKHLSATAIVEEFEELGMRFYVFFLDVPESGGAKDERDLSAFEAAMSTSEQALVQQIRGVLESH